MWHDAAWSGMMWHEKNQSFQFQWWFLAGQNRAKPKYVNLWLAKKGCCDKGDGQWKCAIFHSIAHVDMFCPRQLVSAHVIPTVGFPAIWINLVNDPISIVLQTSQISKRVQQRAMSEYRGRLFFNVFKEFATCHVINSIVWYWPIESQRPDVVLIVKTIPCWGRPISANARFAKQNAAPGNKRSWKSFRTMVWEELKYRTVFLVAPCKQWLQWTNHPIERMEAGTTRAPQFARCVAPAAPTRNSPTCCVLCSSCEDDELIAVGVHSSLRKLSRLAAHAAHFPFRFLSRHGRPPQQPGHTCLVWPSGAREQAQTWLQGRQVLPRFFGWILACPACRHGEVLRCSQEHQGARVQIKVGKRDGGTAC